MIELPLNRSNDLRLAGAFALAVLCVSVIAGWFLRSLALVEVLPDSDPMPLAVAVGLLMVALRHWLPSQPIRFRPLARTVSGVTAAVGIVSLLQFAFDRNLGLDLESLHSWLSDDGAVQGRVPLLAALGLTWAGLVGVYDRPRQAAGRARLMTALVLLLWATGLVAALLNGLDLSLVYDWPRYINTGLPTAVGLIIAAMLASLQRRRFDRLRLLTDTETHQRSLLLRYGTIYIVAMTAGLVGVASQQHALRQAVSDVLQHSVAARVMLLRSQPGVPLGDLVRSMPDVLGLDGFGRTGRATLCAQDGSDETRLICYPGPVERAADAVRTTASGSSDSRSAMARALAGEVGIIELRSDTGRHVLAAHSPVGTDAGFVLEQSTAELFASVRRTLDVAMTLFGVAGTAMAVAFCLLAFNGSGNPPDPRFESSRAAGATIPGNLKPMPTTALRQSSRRARRRLPDSSPDHLPDEGSEPTSR